MTRVSSSWSVLWIVSFLWLAAPNARAASLQEVSNWTGGVPNLPADVLMHVYVPDKVATNPPVLTLIHSGDSNASVVLGQASGLKSAADQYGFIIVVPQSDPSSLRCWTTDSTQVWTRDDGGDSNAIKQMVVYALSKYQANPNRVYVTGRSSGAMMTELLLALYPDIFKAGSSFAGMPAGCHGPNDNASNATGYNGTCAGGPVNYTPQQWGDLVRATGAAPLFPKWAYGLFQSKDHYQSSTELLSVQQGYRITDQYMFGPALLVNPVTTMGASSRSVYLPTGTWYDFWTGSTITGGDTATANAPLNQIPLYVRAGSIVPMGPNIQYATQSADPLEIRVYRGQNGSFTLYEDEGDSYDYESGQYAQIPFSWNDTAQQLTIGARTGSYTGMPTSRTFNIVWVGVNHAAGTTVTATADQTVKYTGASAVVSAK